MLANRKVFKSESESRWREDPECSGLIWSNKSCEVSIAEATQTTLDSSSYCSCVALWMGGRHWYLSRAEIYVFYSRELEFTSPALHQDIVSSLPSQSSKHQRFKQLSITIKWGSYKSVCLKDLKWRRDCSLIKEVIVAT